MKKFRKIIYNFRSKSRQQVSDILNLEVNQLMKQNPAFPFGKYAIVKHNADGSAECEITLSLSSKNRIENGL